MNFTNITQNFISWSLQGYTTALGFIFWPLFMSIIIGIIYIHSRSLTVLAVVTLIFVIVFGNTLLGVEAWMTFMQIAVSLILTVLVLVVIIRRYGGR